MAKPLRWVVDHHGEPPGSSWPLSAVSARGSAGWGRPWAMREGSWIWLMARCWWPSWIQRALQLVQMAIGYRPKVMVTRADRHSGQRGMRTSRTGGGRSLYSVLRAVWGAGNQRGVAGGDAPLDSAGRRVVTACRRDGRWAGADLDALGGGLLHLGHQDLQHAVVGRGLDPLGHHMGGQGDRPPEGAVAALDPVELLLGGVMGEVALALDGQQAILHGD